MREIQVAVSDDLIWAQTGQRVPADETVTLALDGNVRELDLTSENAANLREILTGWIQIGHIPEKQDKDGGHGSHGRGHGVHPGGYMEARAKWKKYRDFADANGLMSEDGKHPIYRTPGGGYYYPLKLRQMYEAHQRAQVERNKPDSSQIKYDYNP